MEYKVVWEVSKKAFVEAKSETEAIELVMNGSVEQEEDEITSSPIAFEMKV